MITLARMAMATRFEIVLPGDSPGLRAAGEEALDEIARIESMLSLYRDSSEVSHVNALAAHEAVRVSPEMFSLVERAVALGAETEGAFDVTIAPLVRCWGFMKGSGSPSTEQAIEQARATVGFSFLHLNRAEQSVRFERPGMMLDFGAFGKGYAIDRAVEILREAGVTSGLIHGGTSAVVGIGRQTDGRAWRIAIEGQPAATTSDPQNILAIADLTDESLGVSASWGKSFTVDGKTFGHVLDPRTGRPSENAQLAAVTLESAAESDAFSTALLVDGFRAIEKIAKRRPNSRLLVLRDGALQTHRLDILDATRIHSP